MLKSLKALTLAGVLLAANAPRTQAQPTFTTPTAHEFVYGDPSVVRPMNLSNYSISLSGFDVYLAGWGLPLNGAPSEFVWQYTAVGNPASIAGQGSVIYNDVADLGTGIVYNSITNKFNYLVVYYKLGVGHFLDIYEVPVPIVPTAAPVYNTTIQLSNSTTYGRIRMDSYGQYAVGIVWDYPGIGIQTMAGHNGTWSTVTTLNGTDHESGPDIALYPMNGTIYFNYAYYDASAGNITKSSIDRNIILGNPGTASPVVEDVFNAGLGITSEIVLDCPDYYNVPNWAYTFTDGVKVMVRYMDYNTSFLPNIIAVNDGYFMNVPTMPWYDAYSPTLHYGSGGAGGATGQITVAWYATDNASSNGYIAIEMRADGTAMLSGPDYMALPNAFTPNKYPFYHNAWFPKTTGISLSKNSDYNFAPGRLYAAYFDFNQTTVKYQLHHAFHQWNNSVFSGKGPGGQGIGKDITTTSLDVYPNPFHSGMITTVALPENGTLDLQLLDITGHQVWQYKAPLDKGTHQVKIGDVSGLAAGTYLLNASFNNKKIGTKMLVKQ